MANIVDFLNQQTQTVNQIAEETFWRLIDDDEALRNEIAPGENYLTRELLLLKMQHSNPTIANIYAEEQEILNSRVRMQLNTQLLSNCKVGKQYTFKGMDFVEMNRLELLLNSYSGNTEAIREAIEDYFFGKADDLIPAIDDRAFQLCIWVLTTGNATFSDPLTKARYQLSYTTTPALMLPSLTGTARWTQSTGNALNDLDLHATAFYDRFGYYPREINMRERMIRDIANQAATRLAIAQKSGFPIAEGAAAPAPYYIKDEVVIELIQERLRGAKVRLVDDTYSEELENGDIVDRFFLPANTYFFSEPGLIERAYVPTVEKDFAEGVFTLAEEVSKLPRVERVAAVANVIPACFDSRKLAARQVSDSVSDLVTVP
jgi:hypothetical protein